MSDLADKVAEVTAKLKEQGISTEPVPVVATLEEAAEVDHGNSKMENAESATEEFSATETEAMQKGWKPDGPKSADEFLRAEPLYDEIKQRGKEIKHLRSQVDELIKHVSGMKKAGYENQLDNIKKERANAVARSDLASVEYLDDQLHQVRAELQKEAPPALHPAAAAFVEKYNDLITDYSLESQEIKEFLDFRDRQLAAHHLDPELHMKTLEKDLQKRYPERFTTPEPARRSSVSSVESDSRPLAGRKSSKFSFSDLSSDQKSIYKQFEKRGVMTGAEYIKQLVDTGNLK